MPAASYAQTSNASLTGVVKDPQGGAIPGATVKAVYARTNQKLETLTGTEGTFSFPTLQPGEYMIVVEMAGFKTLSKTGIILQAASRQSTGDLVLEIGGVTDTISVVADAAQMMINTTSGEIGEVIDGRQVQELALNGRNYLDLMKTLPGVVINADTNFVIAGPGNFGSFSINGTRTDMHNLTIDGSTNVDTGSNGTQHVMLNLDAIAEFKVLSSAYQAEYGRSGGGDIKIVTRGGGRKYHGGAYLFHRHEGQNANSFFNNADGIGRPLYRYNYAGYNFGGPIKLPRNALKDKLFFFWGQEWHQQLTPATAAQRRMPTEAEVAGDFSQTLDGNGVRVFIRDPLKTGTCSGSNQTACFEGNRIPASRLSPSGVAILKLFNKFANVPSSMPLFNHQSQEGSNYPRRQENIRVDYKLSNRTTVYARYTQDTDQQILPYGLGWTTGQNFPLTPTIFKQGPARNGSLNITSSISKTLVNEFVFGPSQNNLTLDSEDPTIGTLPGIGANFKPPFPYPSNQFVNINFSGIANQSFGAITNYDRFPYKNSNTTFDFMDNLSKVWRRHLLKTGVFVHRSRKDQAAGNSMTINFANNNNNPNNSGHPYSNALLGEFDSLLAPNKGVYQGQYRSTNVEWFFQDNFKLTRRLTLDFGLRFYMVQPQYDQRLQSGYFNPTLWNPAKAVRLYLPGPGNTAIDPKNPSVTLPSYLVGRIVPNSGDPYNGMGFSGDGYYPGGIKNRGIHYAPRWGFGLDVFGKAKTVLRGGYGMFYDRMSGNVLAFTGTEQPPFFLRPTFNFGNLDTVGGGSGDVALAPFTIVGADPAGYVPTVQNFSLQVQQKIPFNTVLSVGYVGSVSTHLSQRRNINAIPLGTTFKREAQDATRFTGNVIPDSDSTIPQIYKDLGYKFDGGKALAAQFLRPYQGYNAINMIEGVGSSNYHSMQLTVQRRFKRTLTYSFAYTWSRAMATQDSSTGTTNSPDVRLYDYRRASFDRRHNASLNYVWNLPRLSPRLRRSRIAKEMFDDWELSGISQFQVGSPVTPGFSLQPSRAQSYTGSPDINPRLLLAGDPTGPRTRTQWFDASVLRLPEIGTDGTGPQTWLTNPGLMLHDLSVYKNFVVGTGEGRRSLQLRFEMFNALNHPNFAGFNSTLTWNIAADFSDYRAKQSFDPAWVRGTRTGVNPPTGNASQTRLGRALGEVSRVTGASPYRVLQLAAKFYF
jgi:hypothetical protein